MYRNHLTDTLVGSHSCLSGVEFKSVNLNWKKKKSRNKNYWDQRSSLVENLQLLNIVSPKHRNLTKDSSGLGFCARKNMHLIFLKDAKKLLPSNCRDGYFAHTLQSRCDCYYLCSFMSWVFFTSEDSRKWETKCWENIKAEGGSSVITHTCLLGSDSCTYLATGTCCSCKREVRYFRVPSVPRKMQVSNSGSAAPFRPPAPNMVLLFVRVLIITDLWTLNCCDWPCRVGSSLRHTWHDRSYLLNSLSPNKVHYCESFRGKNGRGFVINFIT